MVGNSYHNVPNKQSLSRFLKEPQSNLIRWRFLALQLAVLLLLSLLFVLFDLDRKIAGYLFRPKIGFYLRHQPLWVWMYQYGTMPGAVLALVTLVVWAASFWVERLKAWRRPCLLVVLTIVISAGLLVNAVFKHYWGRPRPNQTIEFGGYWEYRNIFPPGQSGKGRSFPCGHCAMGFVFLSMWGFRRQSKSLAVGGALTGVVLGGLLSATRVVQGGHFVSDTLWSLGIVTMTTTVLYDLIMRRSPKPGGVVQSPKRKLVILTVTLMSLVLMTLGYLTRRPYFDTNLYRFDLNAAIHRIDIHFNADPVRLKVIYTDGGKGRVQVDTKGLGWISADTALAYGTRLKDSTLQMKIDVTVRSYFDELDHTVIVMLPNSTKGKMAISLNGGEPRP